MRLAAPRVDQVFDFDLARREPVRDQPAMASGGMPLGAHQGKPLLARLPDQPTGRSGKLPGLYVVRVATKRFVPQSRVARIRTRLAKAAQRFAFPLIGNPSHGKRICQRTPIELGMAARPGVRAHVDQQLDTGALEHGGQFLHGARTVADGPDFQGAHPTGAPHAYCDPKSAKRTIAMCGLRQRAPGKLAESRYSSGRARFSGPASAWVSVAEPHRVYPMG